ncbi:MAG: hypothetical protein D4R73_07055 [Deltaproteobacteria bacterium]|nr:MAG: hypothetical protein D4R73_07055 [Deltaproteobacteria bacterium]
MSFIGSINAETRKWLGNNGAAFDGRQVYVGCSGAFTVEQLLTRYAPKAKLWGNDVSLYSGVLGAYLTDQAFPLEIAEENYAWLESFISDTEAKAAEIFEGVALFSQNAVLKRLAAAWPMVKRKSCGPPPTDQEDALEVLWGQTRIDFQGWAVLAQVSPVQVMEGYQVLRGNGIILPDGTLNHLAESLLKKEAAGKLMADFGIKPGDIKK